MIERRVQAAIMSADMPPRVAVDGAGSLPEMDFDKPEHGTVEGVLYAIGRTVVGRTVVSVDQAFPHDGMTLYRTKPVGGDVELHDGYRWTEAPTFVTDPDA